MTYLKQRKKVVDYLKERINHEKVNSAEKENFRRSFFGIDPVEVEHSKVTKKDIGVLVDDYIAGKGYTDTFKTRMYIHHGGDYCRILEFINEIDKKGALKGLREKHR